MGKIYYLMGKSSSGKDTLYKEILHKIPELSSIQQDRSVKEKETEWNIILFQKKY